MNAFHSLSYKAKLLPRFKTKFIIDLDVNIGIAELIVLEACAHSFVRHKPNAKGHVIQGSSHLSYQHLLLLLCN